ncbi:glutathione S-transferase family protein [Pseudoalteromonas sp. JBTF-M23]|uniref:Glutathione S-transferase family protein n=1 Tax=Pseudoalteromonas caenipelagi TaxID=2726988 RepID=A0A849VEM4_9GAMM|nr:glutathione S-transferase family protein [Pseudoalteromonas caenipelagi]NOU52169.1 glutathione S-transferase family protein [Pseudoalteromonas caenipelagi]
MYTLYYSPRACSLATQVILRELGQDIEIIDKSNVSNFNAINPVGSIPVLVDEGKVLTEGVAILLYVLQKHHSPMLPGDPLGYHRAVQDMLFANATMHPAYSKLFFIANNVVDEQSKLDLLHKASLRINELWQVVESRLHECDFLGGEQLSAADVLLAVYSHWGHLFAVDIKIGEHTRAMIQRVEARASFVQSLAAEQAQSCSL